MTIETMRAMYKPADGEVTLAAVVVQEYRCLIPITFDQRLPGRVIGRGQVFAGRGVAGALEAGDVFAAFADPAARAPQPARRLAHVVAPAAPVKQEPQGRAADHALVPAARAGEAHVPAPRRELGDMGEMPVLAVAARHVRQNRRGWASRSSVRCGRARSAASTASR